MSLNTNFNVNPYYDDFDEDKKFLRILFKPGFAVQARELTQSQTILQKQVERFGSHVFKNGSVVSGGELFIHNSTYLNVATDYAGTAVNINNFNGKTITNLAGTKTGQVVVVYDANAGTGDPKTVYVKQISGSAFAAGDTITTVEDAPVFANVSTGGAGTGQLFSVNDGVFFYDGFFLKNSAQTIAISKYGTSSNARIGFEITESIVEYTQDTSLLDPAQDASNFQAPGADRFKIDLILSSRALDSADDTQFIELARVQNGTLSYALIYPQYAVLEDTLARRTYDESGNYTVRQFKIALETSAANTAKANVILSPGKAYVYGYEYETIAPTTITFDKPRTTDSVANKRLTADYGYYVYSNTHFGSLPINSLQTVDLHCVSNSTINVTTAGTITNTKIGTARVKSIAFDSASNTQNSATYTYRTYLFDVNVGSITGGNVVVLGTNTGYVQIANSITGSQLYSTANSAYTGSKFRILTGPGAGETPKTITNYNGATQTIQLSEPFINTPNSLSNWSIDFEVNDIKSLSVVSGTTRLAAADIDISSKDPASTYNDTFISDSNLEPLLFNLGQNYIAQNTIADFSYSYKRLYESQSFSSSDSPALTVGTGETISAATSSSAKAENYQIVVTTAGTSPYTVGQIIPANLFTVDTGTRKITVTSGNNMVANITATIDASNPGSKGKTYVGANSTVQTSDGTSIFANNGVILYTANGQVHIMANTVYKTPGSVQSLFVPDVIELVSVLDFNGNQITVANSTTATNVTSRYTLDNGQRDSFYDHSSIRLKAGSLAPNGPLLVRFNRFSSSGAGFFTVDSYVGYNYGSIPSYTSQAIGQIYQLRDCLDYRPVRSIPTTPATANTVSFDVDSTTTGPKIPENGSDILLDYQYYLPRIDKVILNKNRNFEVLQGNPSLTPVVPNDKDGAMTLYILRERAYVANTSDIDVEYIDNKRYTMRDIGNIDKRIGNLEYYTSLSLLEQSALNKQDLTILDSTNLPRFKNGIVVDSFNGTSVADVTNTDYSIAVDPKRKEIRPTFNITSHLLTFDSANSSNYLKAGPIVMPTATHTVFVDQNKSSKVYNINPFNIVNYIGKIQLDPPSDVWIDTDKQPDVLVNLEGDRDAWALITANAYNYEWGNWETYWTGTSETTSVRGEGGWINGQANLGGVWNGQGGGGGAGAAWVQSSVVTTTSAQTRSGTFSRVVPSTITQSLGDRVIDVSIIPYMRNRGVLFSCSDFKPTTELYGFFDNISVNKYIARANKFTLSSNNLGYITQSGNPEAVNVTNTATSTVNATAFIVRTSNREAFVVNLSPSTLLNGATMNLVGQSSGTTIKINGYDHYSGFVTSATSNTIVLAVDATSANNTGDYAGSTVYIVSGTGAGQSATVSSYTAGTRTLTIVGTWTTTPTSSSVYSIGNLTTTSAGDVAGVFNIPNGVFRIGEKNFRLIDNSTGDIGSSSTNGDATFFAQGILQRTENTIISATVPTTQRVAVNDNRVVTTTAVAERVIGWYDPLAQTFLVSPTNYPQGIFLSKARFCFKTKDPTVPVTLQVRSVVNGYPSTSLVYPYTTVTLTPDKVKTTTSPNLDDPTKYTEFVFDSPIFLQPGEHCFVLASNSNKYETYAAEIGKLDTVSARQISEQPYQGSLFLSQNGSTWTAEQNSDLMFRLFRYTFDTGTTQAQFNVNYPSANTVYDLMHLISNDVSVENTSISYQFNSEKAVTGGKTGFLPFTPLTDYPMTDGNGRRVLTTTANTTLTVKATMATNNPDIAPFIDTSRISMIAVENNINDLPLSNSGIVLSSGGTGYSTNANAIVTITGGGGSGATAAAVVTNNVVTSVYLTAAGSGYETSPTITLTDANTTPGTGATITYNGEDKKSGGNSNVRYITRKVNLADGFDSGDLRVYLTAYKPSSSNIRVYYKVLSISDPDAFEDKNYQLMTQLNNTNFVSANYNDYREISYAPGVNGTANNSVSYTSGSTSFSNFRTFAIKIVLTGTSTTDVPKVRDFRAIALPAGS
jgi:hypothetical protein